MSPMPNSQWPSHHNTKMMSPSKPSGTRSGEVLYFPVGHARRSISQSPSKRVPGQPSSLLLPFVTISAAPSGETSSPSSPAKWSAVLLAKSKRSLDLLGSIFVSAALCLLGGLLLFLALILFLLPLNANKPADLLVRIGKPTMFGAVITASIICWILIVLAVMTLLGQ